MKVLFSVLVFVLALTYGSQTVAETSHNDAQDNTAHDEHTDGHGSRQLFPQPKPDRGNAQLPGKVELVEPAFWSKVSGSVTLKWKEVTDASGYHVQVATDPNFKWLVMDKHLFQGTSVEVSNLELGQHYYWRVAASHPGKWAGSTKGYFTRSMFTTK